MTTEQTLTDQIRKIDVRGELKKLDVLDIRETLDKIDLPKIDLPNVELPATDLAGARAQFGDLRSRVGLAVKDLVESASGFAPVTRRDIEDLEARVDAAEKAASKPAAKKAAAKKPAAKKAPAAE